jgi:hypothetical protein
VRLNTHWTFDRRKENYFGRGVIIGSAAGSLASLNSLTRPTPIVNKGDS